MKMMPSRLRNWIPSDKEEKPRLVEIQYLVMSRGVTRGAVVVEAERLLPGTAFVHLLELRSIRSE